MYPKPLRKYQASIACKLTEAERAVAGKDLGVNLQQQDAEQDRQKNFLEESKGKLSSLKTRAKELTRALTTGEVFREVECEVRMIGDGVVQDFRVENNEAIGVPRPARDDERQLALEAFEEEEADALRRQALNDSKADAAARAEAIIDEARIENEKKANAEFAKLESATDPVVIPAGQSPAPVELSSLKIEIAQHEGELHRITLDGCVVKRKHLIPGILLAFTSKAVPCQTADQLINILLTWPSSENRDMLLEVLTKEKKKKEALLTPTQEP